MLPFYILQAERGFAAAAVFVCFLWEEVMVDFWQKKNVTLRGLRIYEKK